MVEGGGTDRADAMMAAWRRERPEFATLPLEIVKRIGRLSTYVEAATRRALEGFDITYAGFDILATLLRSGPPYRMRPGRLASESMLTTGGTSNLLQQLAAAGLIEREPDPDDGRGSWVRLTPAGADLATSVGAATTAAYARLFAQVPGETGRALADAARDVLLILGDEAPRRQRSLPVLACPVMSPGVEMAGGDPNRWDMPGRYLPGRLRWQAADRG